ncbi:hypothetical protein EDD16DRAFT_1445425, partial [Pisolithus croceorrhizus]
DNQLRLLHYPAVLWRCFPVEITDECMYGYPQDFGTAMVLFQDSVSGLEVETPSGLGQLILDPPIPSAIIFNIADILMQWSNDTLKSTLHQVFALVPQDGTGTIQERHSIPF